jgi:hypothetical protein
MRKLILTGLLLLVVGCASDRDRSQGSEYTLYRSRMMSPQGGVADEDLAWPYPHGGMTQSLFDAYDAWQP